MKIAIIGSGSWGIALAKTASENCLVKVLTRRKEVADEINSLQSYKALFPNTKLTFLATTLVSEIQNFSKNILIAVPTKFIKSYCLSLKAKGLNPINIISAAKGFNGTKLQTGTQIISEIWPKANVAVLSGASHAESLVKKAYTSVMIASHNNEIIKLSQNIFNTSYFKLYETNDVFGIELYGAAKNVYSIGAGILDNLGLLDNTKAAYITRTIAELSRLGQKLKVEESTVYSLACLGDLLVTSYSDNSRNYKYGKYLVTKKPEDKPKQIVEGLYTTPLLYKLMKLKKVRMPLLESIHEIVIENQPINKVIKKLISGVYYDKKN